VCIASLAIGYPKFPFVLATNRDEWQDRSSAPLQWWGATASTSNDLLAGKDNVAGGTWLGFNRHGRFSLITNVRSPIENDHQIFAKSRGHLCTAWLTTPIGTEEFQQNLALSMSDYNGYNLIAGNLKERSFFYLSNRLNGKQQFTCAVLKANASTYGLSNAHLDTPWPKMLALKAATEQAIKRADESTPKEVPAKIMAQALTTALFNEHCFDESPLSAVNVNAENFRGTGKSYGRRCSTIAFLSENGELTVKEIQRDGSVISVTLTI
jgi:uncharacterized protein with NRDE domain